MGVAWETPPSVLVCIPHTEHVTMSWALGLRKLIIPGPFQDPVGITGLPFDHARNTAAMRAIETGVDFLFFIDSDVIAPKDAILKLISRGKPLISGVYARRSHPVGIPVMMKPVGQWVTQLPANSVIEVDVVGAGCLLIHRSILEQLPPCAPGEHWFSWRVDKKGTGLYPDGECTSEDFTFNLMVKHHLGIPTLVDTSVVCKHIGLAESLPGHFGPVDMVSVG